MQTGTVKTFNSERGFGFITRDAVAALSSLVGEGLLD